MIYFLLGLLTGIVISAVGIIIVAIKTTSGGRKDG